MSKPEQRAVAERLVEVHNSVDAAWAQFREKFLTRLMAETERAALEQGSRDELLALAEAGQSGAAAGSAFTGRVDAEHHVITAGDISTERLTQLREQWSALNVRQRRTMPRIQIETYASDSLPIMVSSRFDFGVSVKAPIHLASATTDDARLTWDDVCAAVRLNVRVRQLRAERRRQIGLAWFVAAVIVAVGVFFAMA